MILDNINHEEIFSGSSLEIGKIHWYIQKANTEMEKKCWGEKFLENREQTDFKKEVGYDEIHWWIFNKETDIKELCEKTKKTLGYVQKLKEDSFKFKEKHSSESYQKLLNRIKEFADSHKEEIHALYDYVVWLNKKDVLAPIMLFTYRVWGSTRLHHRTVIIEENAIDNDMDRIKHCTEVSIGLKTRSYSNNYTLEDVYDDVSSDIAESVDPEFLDSISVSNEDVLIRTSYKIRSNMAEYFEYIRQSLRNILLDIKKYNAQTKLLYDESFWQSFVKKAIDITIERQVWDFKETFEMWHVKKNEEKKKTEFKFCEQMAAYANERGGVLIVGITDKIPRKIKGIEDLENKLKFTKSTIKRYINYENEFFHFQHLVLKDDTSIDKNCLIIAIAQTKDVISVKDNSEKYYSYPIRSETGLDRVDYETINKQKKFVHRKNYDFILNLPK